MVKTLSTLHYLLNTVYSTCHVTFDNLQCETTQSNTCCGTRALTFYVGHIISFQLQRDRFYSRLRTRHLIHPRGFSLLTVRHFLHSTDSTLYTLRFAPKCPLHTLHFIRHSTLYYPCHWTPDTWHLILDTPQTTTLSTFDRSRHPQHSQHSPRSPLVIPLTVWPRWMDSYGEC